VSDRKDPFDPTGETAQELRVGVGHEFREEAEAGEADARKMTLRSRTLGHVAYEMMVRGDRIAAHAGTAVLSGPIVHSRGDLAIVELASGELAHVNLEGPVVIRAIEAQSPGTTWDRAGATSFLAALRELDMAGTAVSLHGPVSIGEIRGIIEAVTPDHVMLDASTAVYYIPLRDIAAVVSH
jgi:hypothetical protein